MIWPGSGYCPGSTLGQYFGVGGPSLRLTDPRCRWRGKGRLTALWALGAKLLL